MNPAGVRFECRRHPSRDAVIPEDSEALHLAHEVPRLLAWFGRARPKSLET